MACRSHPAYSSVLPVTPGLAVFISNSRVCPCVCVCVCVCASRVNIHSRSTLTSWPSQHPALPNVSRFEHETQEVLVIFVFPPMLFHRTLSYSYRPVCIRMVSTKQTGLCSGQTCHILWRHRILGHGASGVPRFAFTICSKPVPVLTMKSCSSVTNIFGLRFMRYYTGW
jgi:hypothetical protein